MTMPGTAAVAGSPVTPNAEAVRAGDAGFALPYEMANTVIRRNSVACFWRRLDDGAIRSCRERYSAAGSALYLPAWNGASGLCTEFSHEVDCAVSEVDGLAAWRLVWATGHVVLLQPTGAAAERDAWRTGVGHLRRVIPDLGASDDLMFGSFNIVRFDILTISGRGLRMD